MSIARHGWKLPRRRKKALIKRTNAYWYRVLVRALPSERRAMLAIRHPHWFDYIIRQSQPNVDETPILIVDEHTFVSAEVVPLLGVDVDHDMVMTYTTKNHSAN